MTFFITHWNIIFPILAALSVGVTSFIVGRYGLGHQLCFLLGLCFAYLLAIIKEITL
jgi:hypothetical protein